MARVGVESFDLNSTMATVGHGFSVVICRIGFEAAVHGLILAVLIGALGWFLAMRKHKAGVPLVAVFKKLCIFCFILMLPGLITLIMVGQLPVAGYAKLPSIGFFAFWSLVLVSLTSEEMNFQWF